MKLRYIIIIISFCLINSKVDAQPCSNPNELIEIRNFKLLAWELVVFKYLNPVSSGFTYNISPIYPPFYESPSGNSIGVTGCKHTSILFQNVDWMCSSNELISINPAHQIMDVRQLERFEGHIQYVVGYKCTGNYVGSLSANIGSNKFVVMLFI